MKNLSILLFIFIIGFPFSLHSQSAKELEIIQKIKSIDNNIPLAKKDAPSIKSSLRKYKRLARKNKRNHQLAAVSNALIGKALTEKRYYKEATSFLKKAYKYRKKQGEFDPQRWALKALMDNGIERDDFSFIKKYAILWIDLTHQFPDKIKKNYHFDYEGRNFFAEELERLILNIHPEKSIFYPNRYKSWDKRRDTCHDLLDHYFKNFPENHETVLFISKYFYQAIIHDLLNEKKNKDRAIYWKNKSKKMIKKNTSAQEYADFLRFLATQFKQVKYSYRSGTKTTKYEYIGIELMHDYIESCKNLKRYDQVLFGYRYIATRYHVLNDYKKAVQYLATAMKFCHTYKMEDQSVKSIGGLQIIINSIRKEKNETGLSAAKRWKDGYDLTGLLPEEIKDFDSILGNL